MLLLKSVRQEDALLEERRAIDAGRRMGIRLVNGIRGEREPSIHDDEAIATIALTARRILYTGYLDRFSIAATLRDLLNVT